MHVKIDNIPDFYKTNSNNNTEVSRVILEDEKRMQVTLLTYGAALSHLMIPNRNGLLENVVLGYQTDSSYQNNPLYAGATLAPTAGRIKGAELPIHSRLCRLSQNDGSHNLHGGFENASFQNWSIKTYEESPDSCSVTFKLHLPDGLDGFPGNRNFSVSYTLKRPGILEVAYEAESDMPTYFNPSNHAYFNLSGDFTRSGLEQELRIYAALYVANDKEHIPAAILPCAGTAFDFSTPIAPATQMQTFPENGQLKNARGYNNAFLLDDFPAYETPASASLPCARQLKKALSLKDNASGRSLTLFTDAPAVVLYTGGYIGDGHLLTGNTISSNSCAIALEAQDIPDVPHIAPEQYHLTAPGERFRRTILYVF